MNGCAAHKLKDKKPKGKKQVKKIPWQYKPEGLDLKTWQVLLRKQAAKDLSMPVCCADEEKSPGEYIVGNGYLGREYKVVYRGAKSPWNYCSCMDFKTSQLGTCKHLEAVKLWIRKGRRVHTETPPYTSVYIDYGSGRQVRIRIGGDHAEEFRLLAKDYFNEDGSLMPSSYKHFNVFLQRARGIDNTFRCYQDALDYVLERREHEQRAEWAEALTKEDFKSLLRTRLYPYQEKGILFATKAGRCIIADEMGLGKTIQAIGTSELLRKKGYVNNTLIMCPTSLKYQWKREIERFTGQTVRVIEGDHLKRRGQYDGPEAYKIVSYYAACNDIKVLGGMEADMLIIDEVQRLKNWDTQIAKAARKIKSHYAVILSGTPLENKLEELYSVIELVDQFCLGPYYLFRDRYIITDNKGATLGYRNLNEIGGRLKSCLIRRKKSDVKLQMPARQDKNLMVPMTNEQMAVHDEAKWRVSCLLKKWEKMHFLSETDRNRLIQNLQQMRMVCDSTYIIDQKTRFDTKVDEVMNIIGNVVESGDEKVVVFSQWERMTRLIAKEMDGKGIRYEYLHGSVPSVKRKDLVNNFTDIPESRVFLSTDAGSTGLNLQAASILINIDLPWNPAVLEQRVARIYRIGQKKNIQVVNLVSAHTFEEDMIGKLRFKASMFEGVLDGGEDTIFAGSSKFKDMMEQLSTAMNELERAPDTDESIIDKGDEEPKRQETKPGEPVGPVAENEEGDDLQTEGTAGATGQKVASTGLDVQGKEHGMHRAIASRELAAQGLSFFSGLAQTLQSPEATRDFVNEIVEEHPETGEAVLKIPVKDKETVTRLLGDLAKLWVALSAQSTQK